MNSRAETEFNVIVSVEAASAEIDFRLNLRI